MDSYKDDLLMHSGVKGMRWGVRRYQNYDGSLTSAGKRRYNTVQQTSGRIAGMNTRKPSAGGGGASFGELQNVQLSDNQDAVAITYKDSNGKPTVYYCNPKTGAIITETVDRTTGENRTRYGYISRNDPMYEILMTMANKAIVQNAEYKAIKNTVQSTTKLTKEAIDSAEKRKKSSDVASVKRGKQRNEYTK